MNYMIYRAITPEELEASIAEDERIEREAIAAEQQAIAKAFNALQDAANSMETVLETLNQIGLRNIGSICFEDMLLLHASVADASDTLGRWFLREIERRHRREQ